MSQFWTMKGPKRAQSRQKTGHVNRMDTGSWRLLILAARRASTRGIRVSREREFCVISFQLTKAIWIDQVLLNNRKGRTSRPIQLEEEE